MRSVKVRLRGRTVSDTNLHARFQCNGLGCRSLSFDDPFSEACDLVGRVGHVLRTVMRGISRKRLRITRAQILVFDLGEPGFGSRCQQQRIEMNWLALGLPLANDRNLLVDDVVRRHRVCRHQQHENVARAQLLFDLRVPVRPAGHVLIDPKVEYAVLHRRLKICAHEAEPLDLIPGAASPVHPCGYS